jgi:hypothetical protein
MSGFVLKGALVEFMPTFLPIPLPNVIVFQYNPETMTHTWTQAEPVQMGNPLAVKGMPGETFSFTIAMDANDEIADGNAVTKAIAEASGIYSRLAALEMLMYPTGPGKSGLLSAVSMANVSAVSGGSGPTRKVPQSVMPVTLFIWGPGRIVPVRVTALTVTEKLYDSTLNPTHAEAQLTLSVLTPAQLVAAQVDHDVLAKFAKVAYDYTLTLRQTLALANLANAEQSIVGMIPH